MEILPSLAIDFLYRALRPDGDMFPLADRAFVEVFIRIKPDGIHVFLAVSAVESHLPTILKEFLLSFFKCGYVDEIVVGSHKIRDEKLIGRVVLSGEFLRFFCD